MTPLHSKQTHTLITSTSFLSFTIPICIMSTLPSSSASSSAIPNWHEWMCISYHIISYHISGFKHMAVYSYCSTFYKLWICKFRHLQTWQIHVIRDGGYTHNTYINIYWHSLDQTHLTATSWLKSQIKEIDNTQTHNKMDITHISSQYHIQHHSSPSPSPSSSRRVLFLLQKSILTKPFLSFPFLSFTLL